jgi:hypothetical protein
MEGVKEFLADWDNPDAPGNRKSVPLCPSAHGNLNSSGLPGDTGGFSFTPHHQRFLSSLERGVRDLVLVLTGRHGLVTYTSCEGHRYEGLQLTPTERHVGLLLRSPAEAQRVRDLLVEVEATVGPRHAAGPAQLAIMEHTLRDGDAEFPVLDLYFSRRERAGWGEYFAALDPLYDAVVRHLEGAPVVSSGGHAGATNGEEHE